MDTVCNFIKIWLGFKIQQYLGRLPKNIWYYLTQKKKQSKMIAVIFEVFPATGKFEEYLDIAGSLKKELEAIDGFISIERFSSLVEEGKILSLSFWRDEKAVEEWRNIDTHRLAQEKGRENVFSDYRLRVGHVIRDYGMNSRDQVPADSRALHDRSNS